MKRATSPIIAPAVLSIADAADYLNLSKNSVWRLLRDNELTRVKLLRRTVIRRADCDALLQRCVERAAG